MRKVGRYSELEASKNDIFTKVSQALSVIEGTAYMADILPNESKYLDSAVGQRIKTADVAVQQLSALNGKDGREIFDTENVLLGIIEIA